MKQSILIIGSDEKWEERELLAEAKKQMLEARFIMAGDVMVFLDEKKAKLFYKDEDITELFYRSKIIFRRTRGAMDKMFVLANLADAGHQAVFTDSVQSIMNNLNKIYSMHLAVTKDIRHIPTVFLIKGQELDIKPFGLSFPLVIKPAFGRHGEGIIFVEDQETLDKALADNNQSLLVQKALNIKKEYRIFVVGGKCLGVIEKIPEEGSRVANYAAGAEFRQAEIGEQYIQDAIEICRQNKIDIGGVDIAFADGHYYLLEINRCPEFKAFTTATGVNVSEEIIYFISQKM